MRNKRTAFTGILALLLVVPFFASALTAGELQQQIADLLAQVARLQEQLKSLQGTPSHSVAVPPAVEATHNACPSLSRNLSLGAQGTDVLSLQQFLLAQNLLGAGAAQGSFDAATENAVRSWQASHGIVSSGTASSTGYGVVGPRTRALIALNCNLVPAAASCPLAQPPTTSCSTGWRANTDASGCVTSYKCALPLPQATSTAGACTAIALLCPPGTHDEVGPNCSHSCVAGAQQSSILSAAPTTGAAPLLVTFALSATDGTGSNGISYAIDFGDGQATVFARIPAPSLQHTYASAGTYTATVTRVSDCSSWGCLGSNTRVGTATITAGSTAGTSTFSISVSASGQSVRQGEGLRITWNSQNAPAGSAAAFWLVKSSGESLGLITRNQPVNGTFSWQVPGPRCDSNGLCRFVTDTPSAYYTEAGAYWVVGKIYSPADAYLGGFPPANPMMPVYLDTATSSLFNIAK